MYRGPASINESISICSESLKVYGVLVLWCQHLQNISESNVLVFGIRVHRAPEIIERESVSAAISP